MMIRNTIQDLRARGLGAGLINIKHELDQANKYTLFEREISDFFMMAKVHKNYDLF